MSSRTKLKKVKHRIDITGHSICRNVISTFESENILVDQLIDDVDLADRNKLELIEFIRDYTDFLITHPRDKVMDMAMKYQFQKMENLDKFMRLKKSRNNGRRSEDYFDLEKSFQAYRLLYSANIVRPLTNISFNLFRDERNARLCLFGNSFAKDVYIDEIKNISDEVICLTNKTSEYLDSMNDTSNNKISFRHRNFEKMKENASEIYKSIYNQEVCHTRNRDTDNKAVLALGYTAFALGHLMEDEHIALKYSFFPVEQSARVLHHLANNI